MSLNAQHLGAVLLAVTACARAVDDAESTEPGGQTGCAADFSELQPVSNRGAVERAIEIANLLSGDERAQLVPSWRPEARKRSRDIPVFIASSARIGGRQISFVPGGADCVVVAGDYAHADEFTQSLLAKNASTVLALVLLHELGHIQQGRTKDFKPAGFSAEFVPPIIKLADTLNAQASEDEKREVDADKFAADLVAGGFVAGFPPNMARWASAHSIQFLLSDVATQLREPAASKALDAGLVHSNVPMRLFMMQFDIAPDLFGPALQSLPTVIQLVERPLPSIGRGRPKDSGSQER